MRKLITSIMMTGVIVFVSAQDNNSRERSEQHDQRVFEYAQQQHISKTKSVMQALDSISYWSYDFNAMTWNWKNVHQFTYDSNGLCIADLEVENMFGLGRVNQSITYFSYDAQGALLTEYFCNWNINTWDTVRKYVLNYDTFGRYAGKTEYIKQYGLFNAYWKSEYGYDQHGYLNSIGYFGMNAGIWHGYAKHEMMNYSDGRILEEVFFTKIGNEYLETEKDVYLYNMQDILIEKVVYTRENGGWVNDRRYDYVCNANCQLLATIIQKWQNGIWSNVTKNEFDYNTNGVNNEVLSYLWTGQWDQEMKRSLLHNQTFTLNQLNYPVAMTSSLEGMLLDDYWYYWHESNWQDNQHDVYYWSSVTIGLAEDPIDENMKIYPMPAADLLHVESATMGGMLLQVFNLSGQMLFEQASPSAKVTLNVENYPSGVYLLRIEQNATTVMKKVIVQ